MKTKGIRLLLILAGVLFVGVAVTLAAISAWNSDVIGGAGIETFKYVFFKQAGGVYFILTLVGVALALSSFFIKKEK